MPPLDDMHWAHIKAAVEIRGSSLSALARKHGYSSSALRMVKTTAWPAIEQIIAEYIKTPPHKIWPSRYLENGTPKQGLHSELKHNAPKRRRHRQK